MISDISIVIPVYNVQEYLPRFMESLSGQSFENFEAICVNDASTDGSGAILDAWSARDPRVRIVHLSKNHGAGAARNLAIAAASGETLCFADPDDILPPDSLKARYEAYKKYGCIVRAHYERLDHKGYVVYQEPFPDGFEKPLCPAKIGGLPVNYFLKAHWAWLFPTNLLLDKHIYNEENTRTAEDIAFLTRLFFNIEKIIWINDVVYYWIERDNSLSKKEYTFIDYADYFNTCKIFYHEAKKYNSEHLADDYYNELTLDYIQHLNEQIELNTITKDDAEKVLDLMYNICTENNIIKKYKNNFPQHFNGVYWLHTSLQCPDDPVSLRLKQGKDAAYRRQKKYLHTLIDQAGFERKIIINKLDVGKSQLNISYQFSEKHPNEACSVDGETVLPAYAKDRLVEDEKTFKIYERILWLPIAKNGRLSVTLNGHAVFFCLGEEDFQAAIELESIWKFFIHSPYNDAGFPQEIRMARKLARAPVMREKFKNAWMFIDRDTQADDNAEHLYRWIAKHHPEINAYFVLKDSAPDWQRLQSEGFRLIPFGGMEHNILFILADRLLSSQLDNYIHSWIDRKYVGDIRRTKFVYLRHGVVKDDMSPWLNQNDIDLCITSTQAEYNATVRSGARYILTEKDVVLSGLARHDSLLAPCAADNTLLVMPTWRADLLGKWDGKGNRRELNPDFSNSEYAQTWKRLLHNAQLHTMLQQHGLHVVFYPHPCLSDYLDAYNFPNFIELQSNATSSLQTLIKKSRVLLTDFSSIAFDMAYLDKPLIYYQPDSRERYLNGHNWQDGYFDYLKNGFGPVCATEHDVLDALKKIIGRKYIPDDIYISRMKSTFMYKDGKCCERIFLAAYDCGIGETCLS